MTAKRHQSDAKMDTLAIPHGEGKPFPKEAREYKEYLSGISDEILATTAYDPSGSRLKIEPKSVPSNISIGRCTTTLLKEAAQKEAPAIFNNLVDALGMTVTSTVSVNESSALKYALDTQVAVLDGQSEGELKALQAFAKDSLPHYKLLRIVGFFDGSDNDYDYGVVNFYNYVCVGDEYTERGLDDDALVKLKSAQKTVMSNFVELLLKNGREPFSEVLRAVNMRTQAKSLTFEHLLTSGTTCKNNLNQRRLINLYVAFITKHGNPDKVRPVTHAQTPTTEVSTAQHEIPSDFKNRVTSRAKKLEAKSDQLLGATPTPSALLFKKATMALFQQRVDVITKNLMTCIASSGTCSPTNLKAYTQSIDTPFLQAKEELTAYSVALDGEASRMRGADGLLDQIVQLIGRRDAHVASDACKAMMERINLEATKEI